MAAIGEFNSGDAHSRHPSTRTTSPSGYRIATCLPKPQLSDLIAVNLVRDYGRNRRIQFWRRTFSSSVDTHDITVWIPDRDVSPEATTVRSDCRKSGSRLWPQSANSILETHILVIRRHARHHRLDTGSRRVSGSKNG